MERHKPEVGTVYYHRYQFWDRLQYAVRLNDTHPGRGYVEAPPWVWDWMVENEYELPILNGRIETFDIHGKPKFPLGSVDGDLLILKRRTGPIVIG